VDTLLQDLRYALRALAQRPGFTLAAVLTLGLGIGANAGVFTVVNALFLKPPARVARPDELVTVYTSDFSGPRYSASSWVDYLDFRHGSSDVLQDLACYSPRPFNLSSQGNTRRTFGEEVSGNYFAVLGVQPAAGRFFLPDDAHDAARQQEMVLGFGLWQRAFGGDPGIVGRAIRLNGHPFTVVGVAPAGFEGSFRGLRADVWVTLLAHAVLNPGSSDLTNRGDRGLMVVGRLKPGATPASAQARFAVLASQLHAAYPDQWTDVRHDARAITVLPERAARVYPAARGVVLGAVALLMAVVGLVLLICCANVANLLLARAAGRQREIAIRAALGAGRGRLVRQLLTESALLAGLGSLAGLLLATWTSGLLGGLETPLPLPVGLHPSPDWRVVAFTLSVAVITSVGFGLAPALRATRTDLVPALKGGGRPLPVGRRRLTLRDALVVGQVAVSVVLLVLAGLFLRSLGNAQAVNTGFDPHGLVLLTTELSVQGYDSARAGAFYDELGERAAALPGVQAAALAKTVPLGLATERRGTQVDGYTATPGEDLEFGANSVSPGYFHTMGIVLVRGREFTRDDRAGAPAVAIVNESFARRFWPGQDPLGRRIGWPDAWREVVGVARDGKYGSLGEEPQPYFYVPLAQRPETDLTLHVRTTDAAGTQRALQSLVRDLDADLPVRGTTMEAQLGFALLPQRLGATLLGVFGALGATLAAVGLWGVLAFLVSQRAREIGVRIALGAAGRDVRRLVVGRALRLAGIGVAIGLGLAGIAGRLAGGLLFGVAPADPITFLTVPLVLGVVTVAASWWPAHRATTVDPMTALRSD
jgi:predicted permease